MVNKRSAALAVYFHGLFQPCPETGAAQIHKSAAVIIFHRGGETLMCSEKSRKADCSEMSVSNRFKSASRESSREDFAP